MGGAIGLSTGFDGFSSATEVDGEDIGSRPVRIKSENPPRWALDMCIKHSRRGIIIFQLNLIVQHHMKDPIIYTSTADTELFFSVLKQKIKKRFSHILVNYSWEKSYDL